MFNPLVWVATAVVWIFTNVFVKLAELFTKRVAIVAAALVVIAALTAAVMSALYALVSGISLVIPSTITAYAGMFMPSNMGSCVSIIISAHLLRYAYDWNIRIVQYKLF